MNFLAREIWLTILTALKIPYGRVRLSIQWTSILRATTTATWSTSSMWTNLNSRLTKADPPRQTDVFILTNLPSVCATVGNFLFSLLLPHVYTTRPEHLGNLSQKSCQRSPFATRTFACEWPPKYCVFYSIVSRRSFLVCILESDTLQISSPLRFWAASA